jgi:hypothetical protein
VNFITGSVNLEQQFAIDFFNGTINATGARRDQPGRRLRDRQRRRASSSSARRVKLSG